MSDHPSRLQPRRQPGRRPWWEAVEVRPGRTLRLALGPLTIRLGHGDGEWLLARTHDPETGQTSSVRRQVRRGRPETIDARFVHAGDSDTVRLVPRLADRPVVIRPRQPIELLGNQSTTLYLSTPVWVAIEVGDPGIALGEYPVVRLSDTWFGRSTREGELCYSGRTHARHQPDDLPRRAHRAITPLTIHNRADDRLALEKIALPVPMLALYGRADATMVTQGVTLTRESGGDLAGVRVDTTAPDEDLARLSEPRLESGRFGVTRALDLLFGA